MTKKTPFVIGNPAESKSDLLREVSAALGLPVEVLRVLTCAMGLGACTGEVTHIDDKGYVYCTGHGERRRCDGVRRCRKLRPHEIKKLTNGQTIEY